VQIYIGERQGNKVQKHGKFYKNARKTNRMAVLTLIISQESLEKILKKIINRKQI
jgi:hypothetical protein